MALTNYRELEAGGRGLDAGFQWEFFCANCDRRWSSPFKPYRQGQVNGLMARVAGLVSGRKASSVGGDVSDLGWRRARESALSEAQGLAATRYAECPRCHKAVCGECVDRELGTCLPCAGQQRQEDAAKESGRAEPTRRAAQMSCPNCQQTHPGGRFCAACGFDLASTHKTCPGCGALAARQARFCTDCGHGF